MKKRIKILWKFARLILFGTIGSSALLTTFPTAENKIQIHKVLQADPVTEPAPTSTFDSIGTYYYRPSLLTFKTDTTDWDSKLYPSQVSSDTIIKMFNFDRSDPNNDETPTSSRSGFKFELNKEVFSIKEFSSKVTENSLGKIRAPSLSSLVIQITKVDDATGSLEFKVYQSMSLYQVDDDNLVFNSTSAPKPNLQAILLPPTDYKANDGDDTTWKLPDTLKLAKVQFKFDWADQNLINNFITNYAKLPSTLKDDDIAKNFVNITPDFSKAVGQLVVPKPTYTLTPVDGSGILTVKAVLGENFSNTTKEYTKSFINFRLPNSNSQDRSVQLNTVNSDQLVTATIKSSVWDKYSNGSNTFLGQRVAQLLPSQFVNPGYGTFLDVFDGEKVTPPASTTPSSSSSSATDPSPALQITTSTGAQNSIGTLTYLGSRPGQNNLPNFKITKIESFPDDVSGKLGLLVTFQGINSDGSLFETTPTKVEFSGFAKNPDSGQNLFFQWENFIPSQYSSQSAKEINDQYKALAGTVDDQNFTSAVAAKKFIANFFKASKYMEEKISKGVDDNLVSVSMDLKEGTTGTKDSPGTLSSFLVKVKFSKLNGIRDVIFQKEFTPIYNANSIGADKQAKIEPKKKFLGPSSESLEKFPSQIGLKQIKSMFNLEIPPAGQEYTSSLSAADFFYIPNDQEGQILVVIVFPKFNGIENYQFSYLFNNFKKNKIYNTDLELKSTPLSLLSSDFLALDPEDATAVNVQVVYDNLFKYLNPTIKNDLISLSSLQILQRTPTSIKVQVQVDWTKWIQAFITGGGSSSTAVRQANVIRQSQVDNLPTNNNQSQILTFDITGFTGNKKSNWDYSDQSTQLEREILSSNQILAIGLGITGSLILLAMLFGFPYLYRLKKYKKADRIIPDDGNE